MNIAQALATLLPGIPVHESPPAPLPPTAYVVVSELTDSMERQFYGTPTGYRPQERRLTILLTLYGREGWKLADLRPHYHALKRLGDIGITTHPGLPNVLGVTPGAALPPTPDPTSKRPYAGLRLHVTYVE